jgi:hypothetical protein
MSTKTILLTASVALVAALSFLPAPSGAAALGLAPGLCRAGASYDLDACSLRIDGELLPDGTLAVTPSAGRAIACSPSDRASTASATPIGGSDGVESGASFDCDLLGTVAAADHPCTVIAESSTSGWASASASVGCGDAAASCSSSTLTVVESDACHDDDTGEGGGWSCSFHWHVYPTGTFSVMCSISA